LPLGKHLKNLKGRDVLKTVTKRDAIPLHLLRRKRVAAYARVSGPKDAMMHSLSAQISYYSDYIQRHMEWEFAGVYADGAATGTKDNRPEFQRLLADCRAGKIDIVITKSVTRFARNTVTTLKIVRELKLLGVDVHFEKENIHSVSGDGELMLSILASYAQEESRSVSENCKWRIRKMFEEGRTTVTSMLGYRQVDGRLYMVPHEAAIVCNIYADYLSGMGIQRICKKLREQDVFLSPNGIRNILSNEKYTGNMILQKTYTLDHLSKKKCINRGERTFYFVERSHDDIISSEAFAAVQAEIARRAALQRPKKPSAPSYPFTGILRCSKCGAAYRRKHNAAGTKYEKVVWICPTYNDFGKAACDSQQIPEDILYEKVMESGRKLDEISLIHVPGKNRLIFVCENGDVVSLEWHNPSRRQSWTPEMKQAARERQLQKLEERRRST